MKKARGFTLIEMAISMGIFIVAVVATCIMLVEGQRFTRNAEEVSQNNDGARIAAEAIVSALRIAGMGGGLGVWMNNAGTPRLISPIFGNDNIATANNTDDIWMILPDRRAFQDNNCQLNSGGAASLVNGGTGPLNVTCTRSLLNGGASDPKILLVTNFSNPGAILTLPRILTPSDGTGIGVIDYAESGLASFPPRGFRAGDIVYAATVVRFFVGQDASGRRGLYREQGMLSGNTPPSFIVGTVTRMLIQNDIEDLQIAYGVDPTNAGLPQNYVYTNGFPDTGGAAPLRVVRISAVATHSRRMMKSDATSIAIYKPLTVENHLSSGAIDAFRRALYTRRIELTNLSPGNL